MHLLLLALEHWNTLGLRRVLYATVWKHPKKNFLLSNACVHTTSRYPDPLSERGHVIKR